MAVTASAATAPRARSFEQAPGNAKVAIWQGFWGSTLLAIGGIGVGWIAPVSPTMSLPPIAYVQTNGFLLVLWTAMLCFGALFLVRAWLRLGQRIGDWSQVQTVLLYKITALWAAPLMLTFPLFSRDVYAYIGQGRLMVAGLNPYRDGISSLSGYFGLGADTQWTEAPTPYGPIFLWIEQVVVWLSGGNLSANGSIELAVLLFRVVAALGVVLCAYFVVKLSEYFGYSATKNLWLAIANPLFVINFVASVHNDALMLGLALAGVYAAYKRHRVLAAVLVAFSIGVKPITILVLPFIGLIWAGEGASWGRKIWCWLGTGVVVFGVLAGFGFLNGFWFDWVGALSTPGTLWIWYAPAGVISVTIAWLVGLISADAGAVVGKIVKYFFTILGALVALYFVLWGRYRQLMLRMALAFTAVVVTASIIQPWYVLWLMVLFVVAGIGEDQHIRVIYYLTLFFMVVALTDQLNVPHIQFLWIVRVAAII